MNPIMQTILKSLVSVAAIYSLTWAMSNKQIARLTFFDYVVGISIGAVAGVIAVNDQIGYAKGITGLAVFSLFPVAISYVGQRTRFGKEYLKGRPTVLIEDGRILEGNLRHALYNVNDLLLACKKKNAADIANVKTAVLESDGTVSVVIKEQNRQAPQQDAGQQARKGQSTNLIINGAVLWDQLKALGKDDEWLLRELKDKKVRDVDDVLLAYVDSADGFNVHLKQNNRRISPLM